MPIDPNPTALDFPLMALAGAERTPPGHPMTPRRGSSRSPLAHRVLATVVGGYRAAVETAHEVPDPDVPSRMEEVLGVNRRNTEAAPGDARGVRHPDGTDDRATGLDDPREPTEGSPRGGLSELQVHEILLAAIRDIFTSEQTDEIQAVLLETVDRLGGRVMRAADADERSVPVNLTLNAGEPLLAIPPAHEPEAGELLLSHLPRLVEDARHAVDRVERTCRLASDAEQDVLTGLYNRRAYERFAGRLRSGDVLILLDLDDFKTVNDTRGHLVGDQVLRVFGSVLRDQMRITEQAVRLGGDEFLIVLEDPGEHGAELLLERLDLAWRQRRPAPVSFSSGVAEVTAGVDAALEAADRALYQRKKARDGAAAGSRGRR